MKHKKTVIWIVCVLAAYLILALSPAFALRAAVFVSSPTSALTMEYEYDEWSSDIDGKELYRITYNAPVDKTTDTPLITWVLHRIGPFCFANYYGEA